MALSNLGQATESKESLFSLVKRKVLFPELRSSLVHMFLEWFVN